MTTPNNQNDQDQDQDRFGIADVFGGADPLDQGIDAGDPATFDGPNPDVTMTLAQAQAERPGEPVMFVPIREDVEPETPFVRQQDAPQGEPVRLDANAHVIEWRDRTQHRLNLLTGQEQVEPVDDRALRTVHVADVGEAQADPGAVATGSLHVATDATGAVTVTQPPMTVHDAAVPPSMSGDVARRQDQASAQSRDAAGRFVKPDAAAPSETTQGFALKPGEKLAPASQRRVPAVDRDADGLLRQQNRRKGRAQRRAEDPDPGQVEITLTMNDQPGR